MASGYASSASKEAVKSVIDGLEKSPSNTQPSSPIYGNKRGGEGSESAGKPTGGFKNKKGGS